jgi:mannose-1-phosphate guanylyltransferase
MEGAVIGAGTFIENSIVGWKAKIGRWVHLIEMCTFGLDVTVKDGVVLRGASCCPHKTIDLSTWKKGRASDREGSVVYELN